MILTQNRISDVLTFLYDLSAFWLQTATSFPVDRIIQLDYNIKVSFDNQFSFMGNGYPNSMAPEIPYKAGLSVGNDYIHFILGRYPHSIGSGITGNLMVGDNFLYQEISNLSLISNYFTYNISITRFDQMDNLGGGIAKISQREFDGMQQFRVVHRFDINLFNKARFAVDLATIYNSTYGFDLRFFYPFVLSHNYYNYTNFLEKETFDEANNMMNFYLEIAPIRGLSVSLQFAIDQMQVYFETQDSVPAAWGALANVKFSTPISNLGHLDSWFEFAYTKWFAQCIDKDESALFVKSIYRYS